MTDYRELFKKYLRLIAREEGVIYVTAMQISPDFSLEEINMILALSDENYGQ